MLYLQGGVISVKEFLYHSLGPCSGTVRALTKLIVGGYFYRRAHEKFLALRLASSLRIERAHQLMSE